MANPHANEDLVKARRVARFLHAQRRIQKINDADPPLTDQERQQLAAILWPFVADEKAESS